MLCDPLLVVNYELTQHIISALQLQKLLKLKWAPGRQLYRIFQIKSAALILLMEFLESSRNTPEPIYYWCST